MRPVLNKQISEIMKWYFCTLKVSKHESNAKPEYNKIHFLKITKGEVQ